MEKKKHVSFSKINRIHETYNKNDYDRTSIILPVNELFNRYSVYNYKQFFGNSWISKMVEDETQK
jgi:hypothetical protein